MHVSETQTRACLTCRRVICAYFGPNIFDLYCSSEMICVVSVFVGMDQQYVIPDNAYPCNKGDCLISNPNEEWIFSQE